MMLFLSTHAKGKITVKKNLLVSGSVAQLLRSLPKGIVIFFIHAAQNDKLQHISVVFPAWAYTIVLIRRIHYIIYICLS